MFWGKFVLITMQQNYTEPTTTNANCAAWSTFISTHPVCLSRCGICAHVASPLIIKKPKPTSRIKKFKLFLLMFLLIWASSRLENKCLLEVCWKWRIWRPLHLVQKKVQIRNFVYKSIRVTWEVASKHLPSPIIICVSIIQYGYICLLCK